MAIGKPNWIKYLLCDPVALHQKRISSLLFLNSLLQITTMFEKVLLKSQIDQGFAFD